MTDESAVSPEPAEPRGAVARLAEAVAAAQAVARDGDRTAGPMADPMADPATPPLIDAGPPRDEASPLDEEPRSSADDAMKLRDDIEALPTLDDIDGGHAVVVAGQTETPGGHAIPDPPEAGHRRPRRLWPLYVIMALLIIAVPVLAYVGYHLTSNSTTGEVLSGRSKPTAPGYTALVDPTPVALVMQVSDTGEARSLTVLSLSGAGQRGGAVLSVPTNVHMRRTWLGINSFSKTMSANRSDTAGKVIGSELGLGFTDSFKMTDSQLTRLVAPVAPLEIDNPEPVIAPDGTAYPTGTIELTAAQVPGYLGATDAGGSVSGMLDRQQLLWKAWIAAIAKAGPTAAIPGETKVGLGRYLSQLSAGTVQSAAFPFRPAAKVDGQPAVRIERDPAMLLIANAVPLPIASVPGDRATVTLLNGTGPASAPRSIIQRLNYAGAQITSVGNAKSFAIAKTTLTYSDSTVLPFVKAMAEQLGAGRIVYEPSADNGVDVVVVLGRDVMANPPAPLTAEDIGTG